MVLISRFRRNEIYGVINGKIIVTDQCSLSRFEKRFLYRDMKIIREFPLLPLSFTLDVSVPLSLSYGETRYRSNNVAGVLPGIELIIRLISPTLIFQYNEAT